MAYRNTFFRWLFLYSLTFGLTYVLKLFTYLCPETGHTPHNQFNPALPLDSPKKRRACGRMKPSLSGMWRGRRRDTRGWGMEV